MSREERFESAARPNLPIGGVDPDPGPSPTPTPTPAVPAFQAASYRFTLTSMQISETRSAHEDSDKVGFAVAVGSGAPVTLTKDLGNVNNGSFPIGLSIGPIAISDPHTGIAAPYVIVNSGHQNWNSVSTALVATVGTLATAGAKAATAGTTVAGATVSSVALPTIGTILGVLGGYLGGTLNAIIDANCDGPVAAEQPAFKGSDLWANTVNGAYTHTTYHPGIDSNWGCGDNSSYWVTWTITRA